jgi:hypothetical protein
LADTSISSPSVSPSSYSGAADAGTIPSLKYSESAAKLLRLVGSRKLLRVWESQIAIPHAAAAGQGAAQDVAPTALNGIPDDDIIVPAEIPPAVAWDAQPILKGLGSYGSYGGAVLNGYGTSPQDLLQERSSYTPGAYFDFRSGITYGSYGAYGSL